MKALTCGGRKAQRVRETQRDRRQRERDRETETEVAGTDVAEEPARPPSLLLLRGALRVEERAQRSRPHY